jgi:hypothetical protein
MAKIDWVRVDAGWNGKDRNGGEYTIRDGRDATYRKGFWLTEPDYRLGIQEDISTINARGGVRHSCHMRTVAEAKKAAEGGAP